MKKIYLIAVAAMTGVLLTGCGGKYENSQNVINVISREEGSGTRGAFVELLEIHEVDGDDRKVDAVTIDAQVTNNTAVMLTSVAGDEQTIGYVSLGTLSDSVKALSIDGVAATAENIENGSYQVSRPFYIVTKGEQSAATKAFLAFIMSAEGQEIVEANGYVGVGEGAAYTRTKVSGKVVVGGSSSVTPVMEKLAETYRKLNGNAEIEIQQSDSTTGVASVNNGLCDIGMVSRELKESERSDGVEQIRIALDGIVVIVNQNNPLANLTGEQARAVFAGDICRWSELI